MKKEYLYTTAGLALLWMYSNRNHQNHSIGKIVDSKPPGITPCMDGQFSTYAPGGGVCSHHGGWTGVSRSIPKPKEKFSPCSKNRFSNMETLNYILSELKKSGLKVSKKTIKASGMKTIVYWVISIRPKMKFKDNEGEEWDMDMVVMNGAEKEAFRINHPNKHKRFSCYEYEEAINYFIDGYNVLLDRAAVVVQEKEKTDKDGFCDTWGNTVRAMPSTLEKIAKEIRSRGINVRIHKETLPSGEWNGWYLHPSNTKWNDAQLYIYVARANNKVTLVDNGNSVAYECGNAETAINDFIIIHNQKPKELRKPLFKKGDVVIYNGDYYLIPYVLYDEKYKKPFDGKYTLSKGHGSYDNKLKDISEENITLAPSGTISPYDNIRWYGVEGMERLPYYKDLDYQIAYRAYYWSSMSPDRRAKSQIKEYQNHLLSIYDSLVVGRNAEQILKIDTWFIPFVNKYHEKYTSWLHSRSNVASTMVTGPANFNVRKNEKANNAERNKYMAFETWYKKAIARIRKDKTIYPELILTAPIMAGEDDALDRLERKLEKLERLQNEMKTVNKIIRSKKNVNQKLLDMGYSQKVINELVKPDVHGRVGFYSYQLTNNNATIKRVKGRIVQEKREQERRNQGTKRVDFEGGFIEEAHEDNRLRIYFDDIPDAGTRKILKSSGWRWSPRNKAWQRQLTDNAWYSAKSFMAQMKPAAISGIHPRHNIFNIII